MIQPVNGNVLIKVEKVDEVTSASGFIISTEKNVALEKGEIIAAEDAEIVGKTAYYKDYSLSTIKVGDEEYSFLKYDDILGYE